MRARARNPAPIRVIVRGEKPDAECLLNVALSAVFALARYEINVVRSASVCRAFIRQYLERIVVRTIYRLFVRYLCALFIIYTMEICDLRR